MRYLIDGYNLLHAMGVLLGRVGPHRLESARLNLLDRIRALHGDDAGAVTVVFDAANAPPGVRPEQDHQGIRVLFALREEADDLIETLIRHDSAPRRLAVVSDDRRLKEAARRRGCPALGCLDYLEQVRRQAPHPADADGAAKPPGDSDDEKRRWLEAFGDVTDDPWLKGLADFEAPPDDDG